MLATGLAVALDGEVADPPPEVDVPDAGNDGAELADDELGPGTDGAWGTDWPAPADPVPPGAGADAGAVPGTAFISGETCPD